MTEEYRAQNMPYLASNDHAMDQRTETPMDLVKDNHHEEAIWPDRENEHSHPMSLYSLICRSCGAISDDIVNFNKHYFAIHGKPKGNEKNLLETACPNCDKCQVAFPNGDFLQTHASVHHPDLINHDAEKIENDITLLKCQACDFKSKNNDLLNYHTSLAHAAGSNNATTNGMTEHANHNNQNQVDDQTKNMADSEVRPLFSALSTLTIKMSGLSSLIFCPVCGLKAESSSALTKHIRTEHMKTLSLKRKRQREEEKEKEMNDLDANEDSTGHSDEDERPLIVPKVEYQEQDDDPDYVMDQEDIKQETEPVKVPKKRGRKPKHLKEEKEEIDPDFPKEKRKRRKKCQFCSFMYDSVEALSDHIALEHADRSKVVKCTKCDFTTYDENQLSNHVISTHDFQITGKTCPECNRTFRSRYYVILHVKRVHIQKETVCPVCGKLVLEHSLPRHLKIEHNDSGNKCFFCDFSGKSLHEHLRLVHPVPKEFFPCGACDMEFDNADELERHHKHSHEVSEKCRICGFFVAVIDMARHVSSAHDMGLVERCEYCDFCSTLGVMAKHVHEVHLKDDVREKRTCPHCNIRVIVRRLPRHLSLFHPDKFEKFVCDDCGKTYLTESLLRTHKNDKHLKKGYHKCEVCFKDIPKRFMSKHLSLYHDIGLTRKCKHCNWEGTLGLLKNHMSENHNEKVECDICHEVFRASVIRQHVRQAHIIGRIKCDHCELTFRSRHGKNEHIKTIHEKDKHLKQCPHCDYKTRFKHRLKWHINGHAGIKPYACQYCEYQVDKKKRLMDHMMKKHGIAKQD